MTRSKQTSYQALLFDLDGTLINTAIDLINSLQALQKKHQVEPRKFNALRSAVPQGSHAMITAAFEHDARYTAQNPPTLKNALVHKDLVKEFLEHYSAHLHKNPIIFDGLLELISTWESLNKPWGIVTNKPRFLTEPLLKHTPLNNRYSTLVCGDDLTQRKPNPAPLLHAASQLNIEPERCLYVGDDARDVLAAHAANMHCAVAAYDISFPQISAHTWGGDWLLEKTGDLQSIITL